MCCFRRFCGIVLGFGAFWLRGWGGHVSRRFLGGVLKHVKNIYLQKEVSLLLCGIVILVAARCLKCWCKGYGYFWFKEVVEKGLLFT